ncbi:hypothetical protein HDU80_006457 [Chytriomyces hyalinus]|nr:hypothetical protein HDU80_006457 [Chytriomyces hyalinus]
MSQPVGSTGNLPEMSRVAMRVLDLTSIISVLVADLALLVCFMLYIRRNTRISETDKADYTSDAIVHSFFTAVFAALFALKIVLHFDSVNEGKRKREAIDHAKAVSLGHSTSSGARVVSQDQATITASKNRDTRVV